MTSRDHSRLLQIKTSDSSDEEDPNDYLQDPELWRDRLPQPFRMIDNILQDLLYRSWEEIERREVERRKEAARVKIPEISEWIRVSAVDGCGLDGGVRVLQCGLDGYVFAGGSRRFVVLKAPGDQNDEFRMIAQSEDLEAELSTLSIASNKGRNFIAAVCDQGGCSLSNHRLYIGEYIIYAQTCSLLI